MKKINLETVYGISPELIARDIEECLMIVPFDQGVGRLDQGVYTLNETGKAIWGQIDGKHSLHAVIEKLAEIYDASRQAIEKDVVDLAVELRDKGLIVEVEKNSNH